MPHPERDPYAALRETEAALQGEAEAAVARGKAIRPRWDALRRAGMPQTCLNQLRLWRQAIAITGPIDRRLTELDPVRKAIRELTAEAMNRNQGWRWQGQSAVQKIAGEVQRLKSAIQRFESALEVIRRPPPPIPAGPRRDAGIPLKPQSRYQRVLTWLRRWRWVLAIGGAALAVTLYFLVQDP